MSGIRLFILLTLLPLMTSCEYLVPLPAGFYSLGDNPRYRPVIGQTVPLKRDTKLYYPIQVPPESSSLGRFDDVQQSYRNGELVEVPHRIIPSGTLVTVRDVRSVYGAPYERCITAYLIIHLADSAPIKTYYGLGCYHLGDKTMVLARAPWEAASVPEKTVVNR